MPRQRNKTTKITTRKMTALSVGSKNRVKIYVVASYHEPNFKTLSINPFLC